MERTIQAVVGDYLIEATVTLKKKEDGEVLSIMGDVYQSRKGYLYTNGRLYGEQKGWRCGGQCNKEISLIVNKMPEGIDKRTWKWLLEIREKYHLNDMNAGTVKQEEYLKKIHSDGSRYDYTKDCEELEKVGLLYDKDFGGYKYGSKWLFRKIPHVVLERIKDFIG